MLTELLKLETLGGKDEILFLLFRALPLSNNQDVIELKKYCTSNHFSIGRSLDGILRLLEFMTIIEIVNGIVTINYPLFDLSHSNDFLDYFENEDFFKKLFSSLVRENALNNFIRPEALKREVNENIFYVKENLIPTQFLLIRNLLISLDFFIHDNKLDSNNLFIKPKFSNLFQDFFINPRKSNKRQKNKKKSLSVLKNHLKNLEELGKEAEIYVIEFEHRRLAGHPEINEIQRISEDFIDAGFDIESFNDLGSVFLDRFIEVKSFSGELSFHWSKNEVKTAKEIGDNYYLYLVNRTQMKQSDYRPRIYQNPYYQIFENEYWSKDPESWIFTNHQRS